MQRSLLFVCLAMALLLLVRHRGDAAAPDGQWHEKPTQPGYWWRWSLTDSKMSGPKPYVRMPDGGLGLEIVGKSITDWGNARYFEQDMREPETLDGWRRRPTGAGQWLNWQPDTKTMRISDWQRVAGVLREVFTARSPREVGGWFRRLDPPEYE